MDKSKTKQFHLYYYETGEFLQSTITLEQIVISEDKSLKTSDRNVFIQTVISIMYPIQLKSLE